MHPMHIFWMLIIGLVAGALARLIMPGKVPGGIGVTMLLGLCGSLLLGFLGWAVGWYRTPGSGPGLLASFVGALILVGLYHFALTRGLIGKGRQVDRPAR